MCRLIIHADDFGLSEKINEGILKAHLEGILTSTSVMATGAAFEQAVTICQTVGTLDTGVHLTLVGERPVLEGKEIKTLVDNEGRFHKHAWQFVLRYYSGRLSLLEVRHELEAQIQKVQASDVEISHLDSHQHLHMLPRILDITFELAEKYNINAVRYPYEAFCFRMLHRRASLPRIAQLLILNGFCHLGADMNVARTDGLFGFLYGGKFNKRNMLEILERLPKDGTYELMCHPGMDDPKSAYTFWDYHWQDELNALLDPDITDLLKQKGVSLMSYRGLGA